MDVREQAEDGREMAEGDPEGEAFAQEGEEGKALMVVKKKMDTDDKDKNHDKKEEFDRFGKSKPAPKPIPKKKYPKDSGRR